MDLIARLQTELAPEVFTPRAVYDGRKNLFAPRVLPLGETDTREVGHVSFCIFRHLKPFTVYIPSTQREV